MVGSGPPFAHSARCRGASAFDAGCCESDSGSSCRGRMNSGAGEARHRDPLDLPHRVQVRPGPPWMVAMGDGFSAALVPRTARRNGRCHGVIRTGARHSAVRPYNGRIDVHSYTDLSGPRTDRGIEGVCSGFGSGPHADAGLGGCRRDRRMAVFVHAPGDQRERKAVEEPVDPRLRASLWPDR